MESTAAAMAKVVVQITLTGTTNKVRKMKVPSSLPFWQNLSRNQLVKDLLVVSQVSITKQNG